MPPCAADTPTKHYNIGTSSPMSISRKSLGAISSVRLSGSPHPPINPSWLQTAGDTFGPFPFDVLEPNYRRRPARSVTKTGRHANQRCQYIFDGRTLVGIVSQ